MARVSYDSYGSLRHVASLELEVATIRPLHVDRYLSTLIHLPSSIYRDPSTVTHQPSLELEVANKAPLIAFLQYPYSVVHHVVEGSPLYDYVRVDDDGTPRARPALQQNHIEIIVTVLGTTASTGAALVGGERVTWS